MDCDFCQEQPKLVEIMRHSLFLKYSQSQNYHYTKGINEILGNCRTTNNILFKDLLFYDTKEEMLNKIYNTNSEKLKMLGEYYKFHNDIPRMFMLPAIISLNYYHDKRRRLEYFRIAKMIEDENRNNPDKPPKGIVGDSPACLESEQVTQQDPSSSDEIIDKNDKILDGISSICTDKSHVSSNYYNQQPYQFQNFKMQLKKFQNEVRNNPNLHFESYMNQSHGQNLVDQIREQIQMMVQQRKHILKTDDQLKANNAKSTNQQQQSKQQQQQQQQIQQQKQSQSQQQLQSQIDSARTNEMKTSFKNQISERTQNQNRKSSLTNIITMLKQSQFKQKDKKNKNHSIKSDQMHFTPRDTEIRSPTTRTMLPNQQRITNLLKSSKQKCVTPRTQQTSNQSPTNIVPKKVQLLELKVMSDLQNLLQKKLIRDSKQYVTLHLDSITMSQDPRSLTQRITSSNNFNTNTSDLTHKLRTQIGRKKLNIRELNQFRNLAVKIQEPLSNREPRKLNLKSKSNDKVLLPKQINTSGEQKLVYYQQAHSARQPVQTASASQSNPSQSTFAPTNQSSCQTSLVKDLKVIHQKSATQVHQRMKQEGLLKQKLNMDSQLYKAALNIAQKEKPNKLISKTQKDCSKSSSIQFNVKR